jgi:UDP-N-acetylglucosamine acyltransferase
MPKVHPSADVHPNAILADDVEIGPGCVIGAGVRLDPGVKVLAHAFLAGPLHVGEATIIYPNVSLGTPPQDFKFSLGMPTAGVRIGKGCLLRESVTVHAATKPDVPTSIGDRVLMMVGSHAGHDSTVGNDVILANNAALAGHSSVGDRANISAGCMVHQFNRVGRLAFLSGGSAVSTDVPPFCVAWGRNRLHGVNLVGMRRSGIPREHITKVRWAFNKVLRPSMTRPDMIATLTELSHDCPPVQELLRFVVECKRVICPGIGRPSRELVALYRAIKRGTLDTDLPPEDDIG